MIQFILSEKHSDKAGQSLRHILDKVKLWHFHITSNEVMRPKKISNYIHAGAKKCHFGKFSDRAGIAALMNPSQDFKKNFWIGC